MQVQPGPAGNRPPTHHCGTPPAVPIRKRCQATPHRPPGPGLCWRCAAKLQELASRVTLSRCVVQEVAQPPHARTIQRGQRQALSLATPPFWRQHSKCTYDSAAWRKASPLITSCTSQGSSVSSLVASPPWPASRTGLATAAPAVLAACPHAAKRRAARLASESRARLPVPPPPPHLR